MKKNAKRPRDAFSFSLGGMSTIASVVAPTAIADNRFRQIRGAERQRVPETDEPKPRLWRRLRREPA